MARIMLSTGAVVEVRETRTQLASKLSARPSDERFVAVHPAGGNSVDLVAVAHIVSIRSLRRDPDWHDGT
jgi:hypothetical protein